MANKMKPIPDGVSQHHDAWQSRKRSRQSVLAELAVGMVDAAWNKWLHTVNLNSNWCHQKQKEFLDA